jgi:5-methylcytosine-specific restriction protein A
VEFKKNNLYSREEVWQKYHPNLGKKPKGGNWDTGYTIEGKDLLIFMNIGDAGRTGHDYANEYDPNTEIVTWFGKPSSHSNQPIFQELLDGSLRPHFFARWNSRNKFTYIGSGKIIDFTDNYIHKKNKKPIKLTLQLTKNISSIGPSGIPAEEIDDVPGFAKKILVLVNKYERDSAKRQYCLNHFGYRCQICNFSFKDTYGELGEDFCHVHHIEPLSEVGGELDIDPLKDLIPICPNCHGMLHRKKPALKPDELRKLLRIPLKIQ